MGVTVHEWNIQLAKDSVTEGLEDIKKMQEEGDEYGAQRGRENVIRKLTRIHRSPTGTIKAMKATKAQSERMSKG